MKHILLIALMALCAPAMASDDLSCRFLDVAADLPPDYLDIPAFLRRQAD